MPVSASYICGRKACLRMELLAPAGSMAAFKAALLGGADAIYLGGKSFGARRRARALRRSHAITLGEWR